MITEGIKLLRPGGVYVLVGMVHPDSELDITGEQIIRKCITIKGKTFVYYPLAFLLKYGSQNWPVTLVIFIFHRHNASI